MNGFVKRLVCVLLAFIALIPAMPAAHAGFRSGVAGDEVFVSAFELNVYEKADVNSRVIETVPYGKMVLRVAVRNGCAMVSTINDNVGYCFNNQLTTVDPNHYNTPVYCQKNQTPVYLRPSTSAPVMTYLSKNDCVTMVAMTPQGEWLRVEKDRHYGYIPKPYMDYSPYSAGQSAWIVTDSAEVRYDPDFESPIGTLYFGQNLSLVTNYGEWSKVRSGGGFVGYCRSSAVSTVNPNGLNQTVYTQVAGNFLFVSSTDLSGRRMVDANEEMTLVAVDSDGFWARVRYGGKYFYLPYLFLDTQMRLGDYKIVTARQGLNIYEGTKNSSAIVATVPTGTRMWLIDATDTRAKVTTQYNGIICTGYVEIRYLM